MSTKTKTRYVCQECGAMSTQWNGQCHHCSSWNSLIVETVSKKAEQYHYAQTQSGITPITEVSLIEQQRYDTGFQELNRVLGGGLVTGSVVLIGGDPGIGKSTLLLQTVSILAASYKVLYVTGEESLSQVALRAKRMSLGQTQLNLLAETQVENIILQAQQYQPQVMVIDSIQTMFTEMQAGTPGGVGQLREATAQLVRYAKSTHTTIFLVGHVTKEGALAGPRVLEHMVDAVLYFEGQQDSRFRVIRAIKNRFGAVNELGVFAMTEGGLKEVSNPSAIFLSGYQQPMPGSSIMATWEGSRPLLVEIQALVDDSYGQQPRRVTAGLENNRLAILLAVLHRHAGVATFGQDIFVNVAGGVKVSETAADLALLAAVVSSLKNQTSQAQTIIFGEVGLGGEIRPVQSGQERLKEAQKHGFVRAIIPHANMSKSKISGIELYPIKHIRELIDVLF
ncbi:MAG: DNA repair protein RadA [Gammaproteobacteria bacterium]|nr:DNA repair protein RadA [Gammaproteobacteria bacterium]